MDTLARKRVYISGTFTRKLADLKKAIRAAGATISTRVNAELDCIITTQAAMAQHAGTIGVPCIGEVELLALLDASGAEPSAPTVPDADAPPTPGLDLTGKKVCVTGKFHQVTRDQIELELKRRGAEVTGSVSSKTDILIAGDKAGSKLASAQKFGITIIDEPALVLILAQKATVEVAPAAPPADPAIPETFAGKLIPAMKGRTVVLTGNFTAFTKGQLAAILKASGATVAPSPRKGLTDVVSGDKWGRTLRDAMARGATVWTEGEVLLTLEGRDLSAFPEPADIPNAEHLASLPAVETGVTEINAPPGTDLKLTLRWKKVAFRTHRRFGEIFGLLYLKDPDHAIVGQLYVDDTPMQPIERTFYGAESFNMMHFWEDGSDTSGANLTYDGKFGFNCASLSLRPHMHVNWKHQGDTSWQFEIMVSESAWWGDVCSLVENEYVNIDTNARTFYVNHHAGPYVVRPERPYGD